MVLTTSSCPATGSPGSSVTLNRDRRGAIMQTFSIGRATRALLGAMFALGAVGCASPSDQEPGTWVDVTTVEMGLAQSEEGIESALIDPARPSDVYVTTDKQG